MLGTAGMIDTLDNTTIYVPCMILSEIVALLMLLIAFTVVRSSLTGGMLWMDGAWTGIAMPPMPLRVIRFRLQPVRLSVLHVCLGYGVREPRRRKPHPRRWPLGGIVVSVTCMAPGERSRPNLQ